MPEKDMEATNAISDSEKLLKRALETQRSGDYVLAEELYHELLANEPNNVNAMHYLAILYMDNNHPELAIPLLSNSIKIDSENAYLQYNLGLAYQSSNEIQAAIHYYKNAININEGFSQALNNLGIAYQHLGKIDLANLYLEKAFTIDPQCIEAYYNFAQTHKFTDADQKFIVSVESLIQDPQIQGNPLIKLHFALGKVFDDLRKYELAFNHYSKANHLKFNGFNIESLQSYTQKIIHIFNKDTITKLSSKVESARKRFIFIVGMPRSGTTLVEQIIANHPLVQSGGEIGFIGDVIDELPSLLPQENAYPQCMEQFTSQQISQISLKFNTYLDNMGGNFLNITDKSPINFLHLGLIKILFPESVIVHVERNPVATCLSCYFQNFDRQHQYSYNLESLAEFYQTYSQIMKHWESLFADQMIKISYEELIMSPPDIMRNLISQCGLDWDNACAEYYKGKNVVSSASKWQSRQPIYNKSMDRWKNYEKFIAPLLKLQNI